ncbi:DUF1836 domain-containing protein [Loigolactobacillus zhaoyuanensis]|uniref:DUF1836 domain-containing protein n=1 Tax=Loigolactobacillus zhaoyuanensis TaxID=2486017 RepID=A0ABW8UDL5_9LACO|nr:DUF1836 domain-containing protein [Loigolactobacillus zhaoyuanensis]
MPTQTEDFQKWLTKFQAIQLPYWSDFPDFDIYMEQLVSLVNQYLAPLALDPVTPAMINNYVKHKVMFKPVKKRYQRQHLAAVITLTLLKTVFPLDMIRGGFAGELNALSAQAAYDRFIHNFTTQLQALNLTQAVPLPFTNEFTWEVAVQQTAATTIIYQLISERLMLHAPHTKKGVIVHD